MFKPLKWLTTTLRKLLHSASTRDWRWNFSISTTLPKVRRSHHDSYCVPSISTESRNMSHSTANIEKCAPLLSLKDMSGLRCLRATQATQRFCSQRCIQRQLPRRLSTKYSKEKAVILCFQRRILSLLQTEDGLTGFKHGSGPKLPTLWAIGMAAR